MKRAMILALAALSFAVVLAALANPPKKNAGRPAKQAAASGGMAEVASIPRLKQAVQEAKGKVVLVNFWATWCPPCVKEFPELVKLYNANKDKGFTLIAVSADSENSRVKKVIPFLKQQKATFPTFIKPKGNDIAYMAAVDEAWEGALPRTYLLDRQGRVREVIDAEIDPKQVAASIQKLLAEKPGAAAVPAPEGKSFLAQ